MISGKFSAVIHFISRCIGLLGLFLPAVLPGQVRDWDFTESANEFEKKRFEAEVTTPEANSRWMSHRFDTRRFATREHRFAERKFKSGKIELFRTETYETDELDYEVREVEWFRGKDKQFNGSELRMLRDNTLHQFDREEAFAVDIERAVDVEEVLDQLSLADLNRFQFRRSRSTEEGIPADRAGSESNES